VRPWGCIELMCSRQKENKKSHERVTMKHIQARYISTFKPIEMPPYPVTVSWSHRDPSGTQLTSRARAATLLMVGTRGAGGGT